MSRLVAALLLLAVTSAGAASPLALGTGTACTAMSRSEVQRALGVKRRVVISCAGPDGRIARTFLTPRGEVACQDTVQVGPDGAVTPLGTSCAPHEPSLQRQESHVMNLSGTWDVDAGFAQCTVVVRQNGAEIAMDGDCPGWGGFSGSGTLTFADGRFSASGPSTGFMTCEPATLSGDVAPDGQTFSGRIDCSPYSVTFTSVRRPG